MQFIGRKKELKLLDKAWHSEDAFVMITGRRCVGKTALVREFLKNRNALFFTAQNVSDKMNRMAFENMLYDHMGVSRHGDGENQHVMSWKDAFRLYAETSETGGKVLVIDNFDHLMTASEDFVKIFKNAWQQIFSVNGVMVIIILPSSASLLELAMKKSFMDNITGHIDLKPVGYVEMMREMPHNDFNQLMFLFSVAGGIPKYWQPFSTCVDDKNFRRAIEKNFFDIHGEFYQEVPYLLQKDVWETHVYHSVLLEMSTGLTMPEEIAGATGFKLSQVENTIKNLILLGYVEKTTSIIERRLFGRKTTIYRIKDPMVAFWFTFVAPFVDEIKQGRAGRAKKKLKNHFAEYIQYWFRRVATEIFMTASRQGGVPIRCAEVGEYFNRHHEGIDILGIDVENRKVFLGDCNYSNQPYTKAKFDRFVEHCESIKEIRRNFKNYEKVYGIFSAYPFDKELLDYALITKNVLLFNGITIYSLNS
ncbi:MAG: ATP-binding protein [Eubacteriaceae bacterium]|nr:ATP-binding protein [Eubacteriaceae bacterium]